MSINSIVFKLHKDKSLDLNEQKFLWCFGGNWALRRLQSSNVRASGTIVKTNLDNTGLQWMCRRLMLDPLLRCQACCITHLALSMIFPWWLTLWCCDFTQVLCGTWQEWKRDFSIGAVECEWTGLWALNLYATMPFHCIIYFLKTLQTSNVLMKL